MYISSELRSIARKALKGFWWLSVGVTLVYSILIGLGAVVPILGIVTFVIGGVLEQGLCRYNINLLTRENKPGFNDLFSQFSNFGNAFGLSFMIKLFTALWSCLLVVPGIIAAYSYALAPYLMAENPNIGVMEAIRQSKALMKGRKWKLFCLQFSFIGWALLAVITFGIGLLWLTPYMQAATTAFYLDATGQRDRMSASDAV